MNPNYQQVSSINPSNPQNDAHTRVMRTHNTFPMSYQHALTCRFGDETPFYVFDSEANDKVPFSSFHELRSYTLSSQFLDKINMHKTYFSVPYKAIMPNTWDLFYVPPTHGDDVPDNVAPVFKPLGKLSNFLREYLDNLSDGFELTYNNIDYFVRCYIFLESFFSDGSLLSLLGCKLNKYFYGISSDGTHSRAQFESFSNEFFDYLEEFIRAIADSPIPFFTIRTSDDDRYFEIDLFKNSQIYPDGDLKHVVRSVMEFCRDNPDFIFSLSQDSPSVTFSWSSSSYTIDSSVATADIPINMSRCAAYQLAYFHYLTNDKVDFIYSADLFRNTMIGHFIFTDGIGTFDYNGNQYLYDWISGFYLTIALDNYVANAVSNNEFSMHSYIYLMELLTIRKSLKFGDYFTGSRPQPYAVGDMTAPVVGNGVSAIDMTRNIMAQRFLNAVNKTGRKISDYLKGIRGANTMPLLTDPKFLARDTTTIGTMEVENTANNQGDVVSLLRAEQSKYAFEADIEDPCIILGLVSFSVPRMYCRTIDRFFFKESREDYFNPYFQNIGDQEIYKAEKGNGGLVPFSYTLRHMEYKQRYPIASGGVVDYLPSWFFVADNFYSADERYTYLSPEFIRSHNVEFDRFYKSLNGMSLSSYFHFIIRFVNESSPNRNMEYSPTIL